MKKTKLQPRKLSAWLLVGYLVAMIADYFAPHPTLVYVCDPATLTGSILIGMAISAATTAAEVGFQAIMASRQKKPNPIDRGKIDDARVSTAGFNEQIVKGWGMFRAAPIWIWHAPIIHTTQQSGGSSGGGKGFLSPHVPTAPPVIDHIYTTKLGGVLHDGLLYNGVQRVWFGIDLVYNGNLFQNAAIFREAEYAVLAGGASVVSAPTCSNGRKVTGLGSGGKATFAVTLTASGTYEISIGYLSTTDLVFRVIVNAGTPVDVLCPASGGSSIVAFQTVQLVLASGLNSIEFGNAGAACPDLDRIQITPVIVFDPIDDGDGRSFTGGIDPNKIYPPNLNHSWAFQNEIAVPIGGGGNGGVGNIGSGGAGAGAATLQKWGSPQLRVYPGSANQPIDSAILANKGSGNASAYRNYALLIVDGIQLQNGTLPNVTTEMDQGTRETQVIVGDLYELSGVDRLKVNVAQLAGLLLGDTSAFNPGTYAAVTWTGLINATAGANGAITKTSGAVDTYDAGAYVNTPISAGTDFAIRFILGQSIFSCGFSNTVTPTNAFQLLLGLQINYFGNASGGQFLQVSANGANTMDVGTWQVGDVIQVEIRDGVFSIYQNGLLVSGYTPPVAAFPFYPAIAFFRTGGGPVDVRTASGANIGSRPTVTGAGALVVASRKTAADALVDLMTRFQFDMVNVDGSEKAILRNATSDVTIPFADLRAHDGGEQMPDFDAEITDIDPILLPKGIDVNYSDPQFDYHTVVQSDRLTSGGPWKDIQNISLSVVETADNIKKLATTLLNKAHMESRSFKIFTGPKYMHVHPGTVVTLVLRNATHIARVVSAKYTLPAGKCEFDLVRHAASIYTPSGTGSGAIDPPIVAILGNTYGVIIDGPLLRPEDAGDGSEPVVYTAVAHRGAGTFQGAFFEQEYPVGSGNYSLVTSYDVESMIGLTSGLFASVADPSVWDRVSTLIVNFFSTAELTSASEQDLLANPSLNLLAIVNNTPNVPANPTWINLTGVSVSGSNNLTDTAASGYGNSGASSQETLEAGNFLQFTTAAGGVDITEAFIGLSGFDSDRLDTSIHYAIYLRADGSSFVYERGVFKTGLLSYNALARTFKIEYGHDGVIRFYCDGGLFYTSSIVPATKLYVDTAIGSNGATVKNVQIWTGKDGSVEYVQYRDATPLTAVAPYKNSYSFSTFLRGRFGTDDKVGSHYPGDEVVVIDSSVKPRRMPVSSIGL